ncbi:hypothetical protein JCM8547_004100 [Rhodosporidiobolus lusitaniae]
MQASSEHTQDPVHDFRRASEASDGLSMAKHRPLTEPERGASMSREGVSGIAERAEAVGKGKIKLEVVPSLYSSRLAPTHRTSSASLLSNHLPPPPAYETACSSLSVPPSPSRHIRSPSVESARSDLSDPTSDSETPLNDLLRLTSSLLATSTSILASSTALQGSLTRLLSSEGAARSPEGVTAGFSARLAAEKEREREEQGEQGEQDDEEEEQQTSALEGTLRSNLILQDSAEARLNQLDRDVERFDVRLRGRDPVASLLLAHGGGGGVRRREGMVSRESRLEKGRTVYVTAEAEKEEGGERRRKTAAGLGASGGGGGIEGASGGMKRSPSAAAELLGKLANSAGGGGGMRRSTSYSPAGWSSFLSSSSAALEEDGQPVASSSKVTLDEPTSASSLTKSSTLPSLSLIGSSRPTSTFRRVSALPPSAPAPVEEDEDDLSSSTTLAPPSPLSPARLSPSQPRHTSSLRRSPSSSNLSSLPLSPSLSSSPSRPSTPTPSTSFCSLPPSTSPSSPSASSPSTPRRPTHKRTGGSISLPRAGPAVATSFSLSSFEEEGGEGGEVLASPSRAVEASLAKDRLRALAGGAGEAEGKDGGAAAATGKGWWSWS